MCSLADSHRYHRPAQFNGLQRQQLSLFANGWFSRRSSLQRSFDELPIDTYSHACTTSLVFMAHKEVLYTPLHSTAQTTTTTTAAAAARPGWVLVNCIEQRLKGHAMQLDQKSEKTDRSGFSRSVSARRMKLNCSVSLEHGLASSLVELRENENRRPRAASQHNYWA